jgi:hypothetical protein
MPIRNHRRTTEQIMAADYLRVYDEVPVRYAIAPSTASRLAKEKKIQTFGNNPRMVKASHFEKQLEAGFPVIDSQTGEAA